MVKSNNKKSQKMKRQRLYQMKGCASRKNRSTKWCNKCKKMHLYGTCAYNGTYTCPCECHRKIAQKGGSANNYPMTGPFVGSAWKPDLDWPTVDGISGNRNYLEYNNRLVDPQTQIMPYNFKNGWAGGKSRRRKVGGWRYSSTSSSEGSSANPTTKLAVIAKGLKNKRRIRKSKKSKRGGGLIPQTLVNVSNDLMYNFKGAYSALNGDSQPVNPAPYLDQMMQKNTLM